MTFNNPFKYAKAKELFIAPEGMYTGQVGYLQNNKAVWRVVAMQHLL